MPLMRGVFFGLLLAAVGAIGASCSSDQPTVSVGEGCNINTDCTSPLVCAFRKCHVACTTSRDCSPGQRCMASDRPFHVCQLDSERACTFNSDCPMEQTCGTDFQCRDQCAADRDCVKDQLCVGGTCADPMEVVDGGLLVADAAPVEEAGSKGVPCNYTSECPAPLVCRSQLCAYECLQDLDCTPGMTCAGHRCVAGSGTVVGPEGGKVIVSDSKLELDVPKGALRSPAAITMHQLEAWPDGAIGQVFQVEPSGITFDVPATLTYNYDAAEIGATAPTDLRLGLALGSSWVPLPSTVDTAAHKVSANIAHLSTYGLLGPTDAGVAPAP
jgi:hypothetical protein